MGALSSKEYTTVDDIHPALPITRNAIFPQFRVFKVMQHLDHEQYVLLLRKRGIGFRV